MTKFDFKSQLPQIFKDNNLSILPVSRGGYVISDILTFHDFEINDVEINKVEFPPFIETIDYQNINSEALALNCAYCSNMFTDFTQDETLLPTVNGRMSSLTFKFKIDSCNGEKKDFTVKNAQIEIDGGYEGIKSFYLIEAKNTISKDFIIRQLYYPFKLWSKKIKKEVKPIFLTYTNGIFHFREYEFDDCEYYNSIFLKKEKKYIIQEKINNEIIIKKLQEAIIVKEPEIAFPQANSFERIVNLCELLTHKKILSREDITNNYDFDVRQTNYYTDACRYLGLVDKKRVNGQIFYFLTEKGTRLFQLTISERQLKFIELIISHLAFNETLKLYFKKSDVPNKREIVSIMKQCNLNNINSNKTFERKYFHNSELGKLDFRSN